MLSAFVPVPVDEVSGPSILPTSAAAEGPHIYCLYSICIVYFTVLNIIAVREEMRLEFFLEHLASRTLSHH